MSSIDFSKIITDDVGLKVLNSENKVVKIYEYTNLSRVGDDIGRTHTINGKKVACKKARYYNGVVESLGSKITLLMNEHIDSVHFCQKICSSFLFLGLDWKHFSHMNIIKKNPGSFKFIHDNMLKSCEDPVWIKMIGSKLLYKTLRPLAGVFDYPCVQNVKKLESFYVLMNCSDWFQKAIDLMIKIESNSIKSNPVFSDLKENFIKIKRHLDNCKDHVNIMKASIPMLFVQSHFPSEILKLENIIAEKSKEIQELRRDLSVQSKKLEEKILDESLNPFTIDDVNVMNAEISNLKKDVFDLLEIKAENEKDLEFQLAEKEKLVSKLGKLEENNYFDSEDWKALERMNDELCSKVVFLEKSLTLTRQKWKDFHINEKKISISQQPEKLEYRGNVSAKFKLKIEEKDSYNGEVESLVSLNYEDELKRLLDVDTSQSPYDYVNKSLNNFGCYYFSDSTKSYIKKMKMDIFEMNSDDWIVCAMICNDNDLKFSIIGSKGICFTRNFNERYTYGQNSDEYVTIVQERILKEKTIESEKVKSFCMSLIGNIVSHKMLDDLHYTNDAKLKDKEEKK